MIDHLNTHNDPAFKRRGFSVFVKVTELITYLKIKIAKPLPESDLKRLLWHEEPNKKAYKNDIN